MTALFVAGWAVIALFASIGTIAEMRRHAARKARARAISAPFRAARQISTGTAWQYADMTADDAKFNRRNP